MACNLISMDDNAVEKMLGFTKPGAYPYGRGVCLFINQIDFPGNSRRRGAEKDEQYVEQAMAMLDMDFFKLRNLEADEIKDEIQTTLKMVDERKYSSFVLIIGSHGD